jgi:RNA polymerase sigma-70 factor (subfamily 1)
MNESLKTQALISQIQNGSSAARDELCQRYLERVYSAVRLRLGARLRAKVQSCDIVQQAMLDVVKGAEDFECRSEGKFLNYVNRAVENRIRDEADHWHAQKRDIKKEIAIEGAQTPQNSNPLELPDAHSGPTPSLVAIRQEELATLERAMDLLGEQSQEYRDLIIAVQIEGQTYAEIAEELGKSPDAIRMQTKRAQAELAKIYRSLDEGA